MKLTEIELTDFQNRITNKIQEKMFQIVFKFEDPKL